MLLRLQRDYKILQTYHTLLKNNNIGEEAADDIAAVLFHNELNYKNYI